MKVEKVVSMLNAQDMDRAIGFYRDVIGLRVNYQSANWTQMAHGDALVALHGGGTGEFRKSGLGFTVSDIDAACQEVREGGGKAITEPTERPCEPIKLAHLSDTEGNGFEFAQDI